MLPSAANADRDCAPIRVTILGSCVSRDTLETMDREEYPITTYVARQSLLTAGTDASANLPDTFTTSSEFQLRNVRRDIEGCLIETLRDAGDADVLLWDLIDERHGVYEFEDGSVMTRSIDVLGIPELEAVVERARYIPFGSDEHFVRWCGAASMFADALDVLGLRARTLVVAVEWAQHDVAGAVTPWSMGTSAAQANPMFARYYARLEQLGFEVLRIAEPRADPAHRWGPAPFHYENAVYDAIHDAIDHFVASKRSNA